MPVPVLVLAGGLGTRLHAISCDRYPKPMAPIRFRDRSYPFIEFPLAALKSQGFTDIVICIGHHGEQLSEHLGDGARFGLSIRYDDAGPVKTGARVLHAARALRAPDLLVMCGDVYCPIDLCALLDRTRTNERWQAAIGVTLSYGLDDANVVIGARGEVAYYGSDPRPAKDQSAAMDTGVLAVRTEALQAFPECTGLSLNRDIYTRLASIGALGSLVTPTFAEIGTPAAYARFQRVAETGAAYPVSVA